MSREKIIKDLKKKNPNINIADLNTLINLFCDSIKKAVLNNRKVELRGFGSFFTRKKKENYSARNPKTGELIYVPEKNKLRFKASKNLNKIINE